MREGQIERVREREWAWKGTMTGIERHKTQERERWGTGDGAFGPK